MSWCKSKRKWLVQVRLPKQAADRVRGRLINIPGGVFDCEVEAAFFADLLAIDEHGDFAGLNFPTIVKLPSAVTTEEQMLKDLAAVRALVAGRVSRTSDGARGPADPRDPK